MYLFLCATYRLLDTLMDALGHISAALHGTVGALLHRLCGMVSVHLIGEGGKDRVRVVVGAVACGLDWLCGWSVSCTAAYVGFEDVGSHERVGQEWR